MKAFLLTTSTTERKNSFKQEVKLYAASNVKNLGLHEMGRMKKVEKI